MATMSAIMKNPAVQRAIKKLLEQEEKAKSGSDASDAKVAEIIKEQRSPAGYKFGGDVKKPGLYANIHAKRKRIAAGSGEKMRKVGAKGAPTAKAFKQSALTAKKPKKRS